MLANMARLIRSAGCLIIGDEVLNGKILDTNLFEFAKFCFSELCVPLKKTVVCGDDHSDIVASLQVLRNAECDFIVTSGGIGSTHDDITYDAIAAAFNVPCTLDLETVAKMNALRGDYLLKLTQPQRDAFYRMATIPQASESVPVLKLFTDKSLWVPIVGVNEQVYILPGVPQLFKRLLSGLGESVKPRVIQLKCNRYFVKTTTGELSLAPYLTALQQRCNETYGPGAVKLGSYPHLNWRINTISIIGEEAVPIDALRSIVAEVVANIGENAAEITSEEEDLMSTTEPPVA
ncbi:hypothetical protein PUMCH_002922 [Australozyma saopauloensis]|uniref:MoaB/Mog domain-containing protein n=1 Tax=Australozyma saopauloensis TaxID=291208 RepID=A0AAX4HAL2_9ASCO|nr:hypothetical protein PUMCH_002922 [[Candida] saopauloensis]